MKRNKIKYDRWFRMLLLSFALLTGGGWMAWGQTDTKPIISLKWEEKAHNDVHTEEKIIYVDPDKPRVLSIPELSINNRSDDDNSYNWFVHWYVLNSNDGTTGTIQHKSITVNGIDASNRGGSIGEGTSVTINGTNTKQYTTSDFFVQVKETQGLLWSNTLKISGVIPLIGNKRGLGIDASAIEYTLPSNYNEGDVIYCDVSVYQNGVWISNSSSTNVVGTYKEPTLLKRYKYVIKKADECPAFNGKSEIYDIDFPDKTASINLSMSYAPDNYFWKGTDGTIHQGDQFVYQINGMGEFQPFHLVTKTAKLKFQQTQKIERKDLYTDQENIVEVKAICSVHQNEVSHVLATFKFRPVKNAEFKLEEDLDKGKDDDRWPRGNTEKYELIGIVDFDQKEKTTTIAPGENMSSKPVGTESEARTSYGFIRKDGASLLDKDNKCWTSYPGMYGLFRSANAENSKDKGDCYVSGDVKRYYKWITPRIEEAYNYPNKIYDKRKLYDRTYVVTKETATPQYGYFYYIDATDEPGVLVSVPIDGSLCGNTELTVTGWLADMTRPGYDKWADGNPLPLAPNLNIVLKGVTSEGEVVLHRFTTGDALTDYRNNDDLETLVTDPSTIARDKMFNINLMKWQQFHYKFIISEEKIAGCSDFRLEVQNNEPHTDGADYAIDDIRVFRTKPQVSLVQVVDPCSESSADKKISLVKFQTDYSTLLTNMGLKRGENTLVQNVVINDDIDPIEEQTIAQLKKFLEDQKQKGVEVDLKKFTKIAYMIYDKEDLSKPIKIKYDGEHDSYYRISYLSTVQEWMEWTGNYSFDPENPINTITSTTLNIGGALEADKEYIVRVYAGDIDLLENENAEIYSIKGENERCAMIGTFSIPLAQGLLDIKNAEANVSIKSENMEIGTKYTLTANLVVLNDQLEPDPDNNPENPIFYWFFGTKEEFEAKTLKLDNGRTISVHDAFTGLGTDTDKLMDEEIKKALDSKYGILDENVNVFNPDKRIILNKTVVELTMTDGYLPVLIYAPNYQDALKDIENKNRYCSDPKVINLGGNPPTIEPGDPDVPDPDPEDPTPETPKPDEFEGTYVRSVRIGLVQMQKMMKDGTLRIPIHFRAAGNETDWSDGYRFTVDTDNKDIKVCETSDNQWKNKENWEQIPIALLEDLVDEGEVAKWDANYFKIKFNQDVISNIREGFWYMVKVPYKYWNKKVDDKKIHRETFKLTFKIVPEYVTWVGYEDDKHNWNNDDLSHWRRSNNEELYMGSNDLLTGAQANGTHIEAYTPMRFTKVTIAGKLGNVPYAAYPYLYKLKKQEEMMILDMTTGIEGIGDATKNIEYDLLADPDYQKELFGNEVNPDKPNTGENRNYACVRFYGNTCDEIYIKPESEILHTEYLTYNKAHVDYEMDPNRWYMLASPLKGVVSGDMYLPTGNNGIGKYARQETPAFEDIKYNITDYTRWEPAVYMRGWNSTSVKVIYPNDVANYGELINWSNLYNDVDVPFVSGSGFSIGTKTPLKPEKESVLFRLPKADVSYSYYKDDNMTSKAEKYITSENRQGNGRFYFSPDTTSLNVTTTGMLGNPFMSHLDMKKFFDANHSTNNTYYIMSGNTTITNIAGDEYKLSTESDDPNYVAPLQSFIKNDLKNAVFTTAMIAKAPTSGKKVGLRSVTAAASEKTLPQLRITASRGGVHNTALVAGLVTASDGYIEGEDAALLINEEVAAPQVYTLAGNQMTAINVTPELKDIPVGIYGKDDSPVELSFKLSGDMQNVTLVDKQSGKVYPVTDGLTLTVVGNTSGRYFLNGSIATSNEVIARNEIVCYANGDGQIVVSSVDPLTRISVYSVSGQRLRYLDNLNIQTVYVKDLVPGIYIVKAESLTQVCSEKMEVK